MFQDGYEGNLLYYKCVVDSCFRWGVKMEGLDHTPSLKDPMVNVLLVEGGGLVKSFWTDSNCVITSYLNSLCSFNWIRYFSLLIQNSDIAFLGSGKQLLHRPRCCLELDSGGVFHQFWEYSSLLSKFNKGSFGILANIYITKSLIKLGYIVNIGFVGRKWPQGSSRLASFLHRKKLNC